MFIASNVYTSWLLKFLTPALSKKDVYMHEILTKLFLWKNLLLKLHIKENVKNILKVNKLVIEENYNGSNI
jgi:hypothetical protein